MWHFRALTLNEVQQQAVALSSEERRKLTAMRMKESGEWEQVTGETPDRTGWISLDEAKQRLLGGN